MKAIFSWLNKPYYFNPKPLYKLKISIYHGLFIFLFLYIFRPFYLHEFDEIILPYTIGIGITAFVATFLILYIPALIFKDYFSEDNWTIGRNLLLMFVGVTFIGVALWYFGEIYKEPYNLRKINLLQFLSYTFLVSLIPLTFFVFLNEKNIRLRREKKVKEIRELKKVQELNNTEKLTKEVSITSENGKEKISFCIDNLVYVTSQGNYASFFIKKDDKINEKILRVTLAKIIAKLEKYPTVIRCHKSYIVNTNYITDISGNARGYLLKSKVIEIDIPVSRSFSKQSLLRLIS